MFCRFHTNSIIKNSIELPNLFMAKKVFKSLTFCWICLTNSLLYICARNVPGGNTAILILLWCYI